MLAIVPAGLCELPYLMSWRLCARMLNRIAYRGWPVGSVSLQNMLAVGCASMSDMLAQQFG